MSLQKHSCPGHPTNVDYRVEEEYYEDEDEPVPDLPPIPAEHLQHYQQTTKISPEKTDNDHDDNKNNDNDNNTTTTRNDYNDDDDANSFDDTVNSPQLNLQKFQNIDLDEELPEKEQEHDPVSATVDEYANIIRDDDSEEEEDYKPTTSRFQPLPRSPEVERFETLKGQKTIPVEEENNEIEAQSSSFQPFPEEHHHISKVDHKEGSSTPQELPKHEEPHPVSTPVVIDDAKSLSKESIVEEKTQNDHVHSDFQPFPEDQSNHSAVESTVQDNDVEDEQPPAEQEVVEQENTDDDIIPQVEDSEDEEYIPSSNRFKSSILEDEAQQKEPVSADSSIEEIGSTTIPPQIESSEILDEEPKRVDIPPVPSTTPIETQNHIDPVTDSLQLPTSNRQDFDDVSDTDTLHIHDPEEQSSPSIEEIRRELSNTSLHDLTHDNTYFHEHAYLGSLINTPEPEDENEAKFQPQDEKNDEANDAAPRTLSQYYSSVNDYFDDYADTSDNENLKVNRDSRASVQSSGSLSTGSFSIKSESRYRYSKASDRDSSFNHSNSDVHSLNPAQQLLADNASTNETDQTPKDTNLNPALSINFGHWRPDTDSFRDQFISGTAPPLPQIDNYTRNSMGEIIEDRGSIIEKDKELDSSNDKGEDHEKSLDSLGNTMSTSETDNHSTLSEPKPVGESYKTESNSVLPLHIPLGSNESTELNPGQYFHEKLAATETNLPKEDEVPKDVPSTTKLNITKISGNKRTNYSIKLISSISDPAKRIESLRNAREEEANLNLGLNEWLVFAKSSAGVETYKSNVHNSHVAQAYADASTMSRKHTLNNVGSFLHKRRVFQDTSSHAQSLAKGIFTRGKKMLKNDN